MTLWEENSCECLYESYREKGDYTNALKYLEELAQIKESVKNDERIREITTLELQTNFRQTRLKDSLKQTLLAEQQQHAIQQEKSKNLLLFIGLGSVGVVAVLLFIGFRSKKKDNLTITEQKNAVEQKQIEILDSIVYAKRLQDAILPSPEVIGAFLPSHFVYFSPKDVVSGDFYWCENIDEDLVLFGAADCTGHGVPGALVSVVCSNAIMRSVNEYGCRKPSDILDSVTKIVEKTFEQSGSEIKDGMDVALCLYNTKTRLLQFSGANNPLWIVRKNADLKEEELNGARVEYSDDGANALIEFKGDRQPVGRYVATKPFKNIEVQLQEGDLLYVFSDGYADQFGGKKGKKFKYVTLKKALMELAGTNMKEQRDRLEEIIHNWRGELEQTDDICVFGVRI